MSARRGAAGGRIAPHWLVPVSPEERGATLEPGTLGDPAFAAAQAYYTPAQVQRVLDRYHDLLPSPASAPLSDDKPRRSHDAPESFEGLARMRADVMTALHELAAIPGTCDREIAIVAFRTYIYRRYDPARRTERGDTPEEIAEILRWKPRLARLYLRHAPHRIADILSRRRER